MVAIQREQLLDQRVSSAAREPILREAAQGEDQGSADGNVLLVVESFGQRLGIGAERTESMSQIASHRRIRCMLEQRPCSFGLAESDHRHTRVRLSFGQCLPGVALGRNRLVQLGLQHRSDGVLVNLEARAKLCKLHQVGIHQQIGE